MNKNKYILVPLLFLLIGINSVIAAPAELFGTTLIADISEQVSPAVVAIESIHYVRTRTLYGSGDPFFDRFFSHLFDDDFNGSNNVIPQKGSGSGVIISDDGYLLTNEHVISSADEILVKFGDGRSFKAKIIGKDKTSDLAVLKIESPDKLSFMNLGDSDSVRVGEWVIAIGNPFGLGITVTCGVVSAVKRDLSVDKDTNYRDLIQTDASINPGNSGGALVNSKGELIGINTAIMPSGQGIGFAIPVNRAKRIVGDLIKYGKVKKISAGLTVQNITKELAEYFNVPENGILITSVSEGSVAAEAGLVPSDIVTMIDNTKIKDVSSFETALERYSVGQSAIFKVLRKGKLSNVRIKFKETKASLNPLGVEVKTITDKLINKYNLFIEQGAVIVDIAEDSPTYKAGLRTGDVIIQIGNKPIRNEEDLNSVMKVVNKLDAVMLRIVRRNSVIRLTINLQ
jgi:serine protease Do